MGQFFIKVFSQVDIHAIYYIEKKVTKFEDKFF